MTNIITDYFPYNVIDACSIWNLLSSTIIYHSAIDNDIQFCCTSFVIYECLHKPRTNVDGKQLELIQRLKNERKKSIFKDFTITIEDLQNIEILRNRKRQSKGELSSMIFAKKTNQAFITDDQSARKLAIKYLPENRVQTIPLLFGYLVYKGLLLDNQVKQAISEHKELEDSITFWLDNAYKKGLELRLMNTT